MKLNISDTVKNVFNKMIGIEDIDEFIVADKYDRIREQCFKFLTLLDNINSFGLIDFGDEASKFVCMSESFLESNKIEQNNFTTDLSEVNGSNNPEEQLVITLQKARYNKDQLIEAHDSLMHNNPVTEIVNFVNKLSQKIKIYKEKFPDVDDSECLSEEMFITNTNGIIFEFSNIDIRYIFVSRSIEEENKSRLIRSIKLLYKVAKDTIEEIAKPNINPEDYIAVIAEAVVNARKKVQRCNDAFNIINGSLDTFREKFTSYYRVFLKSGNPASILTEYIDDISKNVTDMSPQVKRQFKQIYKTFSAEMTNIGKNSEMDGLFGEFDTIMFQYI